MSRLSDFAIRVEAPNRSGGLGGGVAAVLSELLGMLERVAQKAGSDTIDLRSLPMSPHDRIELQQVLGQGEVRATLSTEGTSTLQETAVAGVWWIEHRDKQGELIAELLEVAAIPEILEVSRDEMMEGAHSLRERLSIAREAPQSTDHATAS